MGYSASLLSVMKADREYSTRATVRLAVETLAASDVLFALLSFPRVNRWSRSDVLARDFATVSGLVNTVPVYRVTIPWGPPFNTDIAPALAALV